MSRRSHVGTEYYADEREAYTRREAPRSRAPVAEYEELDIRDRKSRRSEPEFLREDYGRSSHAGPLVMRERSRSRERPAPSNVGKSRGELEVKEDVIIREKSRERPRKRDVATEEEIVIRERSRERPRRQEIREEEIEIVSKDQDPSRRRDYDEYVIIPERPPQQVWREREQFTYRENDRDDSYGEPFLPPPRREPRGQDVRREYEDIEFRERRREPSPESVREEIIIRDDERPRPPRREEREEEIIIRENDRSRPRPYDRHEEEIIIKDREREKPRRYEDFEEEIRIRERDRERPRYRDTYEEDISIRERDRDRRGYLDDRDEEISIRERERPRARFDDERREIIIRDRERENGRSRYEDERDETIVIRERSREPSRRDRRLDEDDIYVRDKQRDRDRLRPRRSFERDSVILGRDRSRPGTHIDQRDDELVVRHSHGSPTPSRAASIRRNDYREDDISIRRGERERDLPRRRDRSRDREEDDIIIRHDKKGGTHSDEIVIRHKSRSPSPVAAPSPPPPEPVRAPPVIQEVITHHRHIDHGFERALESPRRRSPPRKRSPSEDRIEIRHRSKSRGRFHEDDINIEIDRGNRKRLEGVHRGHGEVESENRELALVDTRDPRRYVKQDDPRDRLWTEITEDLVSEEAIKEMGYEYSKSGGNYYVYKFLKYDDVQALVDLTEEISQDRRDRLRDIQNERSFRRDEGQRRLPPSGQQWDEERVVEREIIYDDGRRRRL